MKIKILNLFLIISFSACTTIPITGRKTFILLSEEQENSHGLAAYREILRKEKLTANGKLSNQVNTFLRLKSENVRDGLLASFPELKINDLDDKQTFVHLRRLRDNW